jgi:uncharacterized protein with GYD domain
MPSVRELRLHRIAIGDAGLLHLFEMKQLTLIVLYETNVTDKGAKALEQAPPRIRVVR